jgi:hypothetical protein
MAFSTGTLYHFLATLPYCHISNIFTPSPWLKRFPSLLVISASHPNTVLRETIGTVLPRCDSQCPQLQPFPLKLFPSMIMMNVHIVFITPKVTKMRMRRRGARTSSRKWSRWETSRSNSSHNPHFGGTIYQMSPRRRILIFVSYYLRYSVASTQALTRTSPTPPASEMRAWWQFQRFLS